MATIAVDLDDTCYSFTSLAREVMADLAVRLGDKTLERGAYAPWDEWRAPVDLLGLKAWLGIIDICHEPGNILDQRPFPRAAEVLWELVESGHDLIYISHRAEEAFAPTAEWLLCNDFPIHQAAHTDGEAVGALFAPLSDNVVMTKLICTALPKAPFLEDAQYMLDDRPKNIYEFLSDFEWRRTHDDAPRQAFALMAPYNRGMTDIPNVFIAPGQSWSVLRHYLVREGVLLNGDRNAARA